jgi:hypothetical protein
MGGGPLSPPVAVRSEFMYFHMIQYKSSRPPAKLKEFLVMRTWQLIHKHIEGYKKVSETQKFT